MPHDALMRGDDVGQVIARWRDPVDAPQHHQNALRVKVAAMLRDPSVAARVHRRFSNRPPAGASGADALWVRAALADAPEAPPSPRWVGGSSETGE